MSPMPITKITIYAYGVWAVLAIVALFGCIMVILGASSKQPQLISMGFVFVVLAVIVVLLVSMGPMIMKKPH